MLAELKQKSQLTIPKKIVNEMGLEIGDQFDVVVDNGVIKLIPVVVYPKDKLEKLEQLADEARTAHRAGKLKAYDADALFDDLDTQ